MASKVQAPLFIREPKYYANPDGKAPIEKIIALGKRGLALAIGTGLMDCVYITDTKNALETINCMAYWVIPTLGLTTTFASVTYMSTRIRGKDDELNYINGVVACAPILHAWKKSLAFAISGTAVGMFLAYCAKTKQNAGWRLLPSVDLPHAYDIHWANLSMVPSGDKDFRSGYIRSIF